MAELDLKELISKVREELEELDRERESSGKAVLFELQTLKLEIKFAVTKSMAAKGGISLHVLSIGADGSAQDEHVQTIQLEYRVAKSADKHKLPGAKAHASTPAEQSGGIGLLK